MISKKIKLYDWQEWSTNNKSLPTACRNAGFNQQGLKEY
jgi:hypothetical protein